MARGRAAASCEFWIGLGYDFGRESSNVEQQQPPPGHRFARPTSPSAPRGRGCLQTPCREYKRSCRVCAAHRNTPSHIRRGAFRVAPRTLRHDPLCELATYCFLSGLRSIVRSFRTCDHRSLRVAMFRRSGFDKTAPAQKNLRQDRAGLHR